MNDISNSISLEDLNLQKSVQKDTKNSYRKTSKKQKSILNSPIISYRTASRLVAVQGLYAMEMTQKRPSQIIPEITALHNNTLNDSSIKSSDPLTHILSDKFDLDYAVSLLHGVVREQRVIDPLLVDTLTEKWSFNRLDKVIRAILRVGTYELLFAPETPSKVVINEYTNIGSSFRLNDNNALINGILNAIYQSHKHTE